MGPRQYLVQITLDFGTTVYVSLGNEFVVFAIATTAQSIGFFSRKDMIIFYSVFQSVKVLQFAVITVLWSHVIVFRGRVFSFWFIVSNISFQTGLHRRIASLPLPKEKKRGIYGRRHMCVYV